MLKRALVCLGLALGLCLGIWGSGLSERVYAEEGDEASQEEGESAATTGGNYTSECGEDEVKTGILGGEGCKKIGTKGEAIMGLLADVLTIMTYGVGVLGVVGITIAGVQYGMAAGDVGKMTKAKQRIIEVVIGLICWGLLYAFLEWLIPGGIL